jgi:hypothetical protein
MISGTIRAGGRRRHAGGLDHRGDDGPPAAATIYGVTKLAAEHLCRLHHELHGLPMVILRTSRFFPEADDMAHLIVQSDANTKANELLFRRLTVEDAAACHLRALEQAPALGFDLFIVSAPTPFKREDCAALIENAPAVVERYFPHYPAIYARLGWTMVDVIDRVYDATRAAERLGFVCRTGFAEKRAELEGRMWGNDFPQAPSVLLSPSLVTGDAAKFRWGAGEIIFPAFLSSPSSAQSTDMARICERWERGLPVSSCQALKMAWTRARSALLLGYRRRPANGEARAMLSVG